MVTPTQKRPQTIRVRISKSGQITLPAKIREELGVELGDQVDIVLEKSGNVYIHPVTPLKIEDFVGSLGPPPGGESLTEYLRGIDEQPMVRRIYEDESKPDNPD